MHYNVSHYNMKWFMSYFGVWKWQVGDLYPILSFINLIIYKHTLACSTSMSYKSLLGFGFFFSFSLALFFLSSLLLLTKSKCIRSLHERYGFASGKKRLHILLSRSLLLKYAGIQTPAIGSTQARCSVHVVPQDSHRAPLQMEQEPTINFSMRL